MPELTGPSHIDLTVTDVERSAQWWEQVMGFSRIGSTEQPTFRTCSLIHTSRFTVTVVSHDATEVERFDETRVGLDHLSFDVADRRVGGRRFRPSLEDLIEFLHAERVLPTLHEGWRDLISASRGDFLRRQLRAAVNNDPEIAVQELSDMGYRIERPG